MLSPELTMRKNWMEVLAKANPQSLVAAWDELEEQPEYHFQQQPRSGSLQLRAQAGHNGRQFNIGDATVSQCSVLLADGTAGYALILGRNSRHAELAALFDALLQNDAKRASLMQMLINPLAREIAEKRAKAASKTAETKVEFFTMAREG